MARARDIGRVSALLELFSDCASVGSLDELLQCSPVGMRWVLEFDRCTLSLDGHTFFSAGRGEPCMTPVEAEALPEPHLEALKRTREQRVPFHATAPASSLCHPLALGDEAVGALCFSAADSSYDHEDARLAHHLANFFSSTITRIQQQETVQRQALQLERLDAINRAKDEFFAILGHELRNPLAPILSAAEVLRHRALPEPPHEVALIERHALHLKRLLSDLLDVSRLTTDKLVLERAVIPAALLVQQALETVQPLVEERAQRLDVQLPGAPLYIDADATRLAQVLTNLLTNASRYSAEGACIYLKVAADDGTVTMEVADQGEGIAPEFLPKVFERFSQASRPQGTKAGLGLGLGIAKSLTELHGGSICAESEGLGKGSRFRVCLPRAPAPTEASEAQAAPSSRQTAQPQRVLVVDDGADAADLLASLLGHNGFEASVAYESRGALAQMEVCRPDIFLLDIGLPEMDGYELARTIRSRLSGRPAFLVALTGYGQPSDRERSREAGFDAHLVKPVDTKELFATLARWDGGAC